MNQDNSKVDALPDKKTIIFDFGNVLFNLDYETCFENFNKVLGVDWNGKNIPDDISEAIKKYEVGDLTDESFLWVFQQYSPTVNPRKIIAAWNSLLIDLPKARLKMLKDLKTEFNLCLLSNINNLHLQWIHKYLSTKLDINNFEDTYFNKVFYSHQIKLRKPDTTIYEYVTENCSLNKKNILFIDDLSVNIEAAISYGWHGQLHNPKENIEALITSYINKAWTSA